jgi:hypothetical protein
MLAAVQKVASFSGIKSCQDFSPPLRGGSKKLYRDHSIYRESRSFRFPAENNRQTITLSFLSGSDRDESCLPLLRPAVCSFLVLRCPARLLLNLPVSSSAAEINHRQKLQADPLYRQICRESQQKWRASHPDYARQYRQAHPDYVRDNRRRQQKRDHHRRLAHLVKNNLAFDLKRSSHEVWLMGPQTTNLVKNNLACSKVLIFETVSGSLLAS